MFVIRLDFNTVFADFFLEFSFRDFLDFSTVFIDFFPYFIKLVSLQIFILSDLVY